MYKLYKYEEPREPRETGEPKKSDEPIEYSVVTPIFNQEDVIVQNVKSVIDTTRGFFEIILILDYCFDKTEERLLAFLDSYTPSNPCLVQIKIFKNIEKPLFETACDNLGFRASVGTYCLEIQADMEMTEVGYNLELVKPFRLLPHVIAVSGRCAHNLFTPHGYGKLGPAIEQSLADLQIQRRKFYVFETCNRGPLMLDRKKLEEIGYLDEENYFLDDSDHDLMARAFLQKKYICGYVPIEFKSPLSAGSTRNSKKYVCLAADINKMTRDELQAKSRKGIHVYKDRWIHRSPTVYSLD
jgi:glycosyltransferase involved in cell wall biosynthesis